MDLPAIQSLLQPYVIAKKLLKRTKAELLTLIGNGFVAEVSIPESNAGDQQNPSLIKPEPMALATGSEPNDSPSDRTMKPEASAYGSGEKTSSAEKLIVGFSAVEIYSRKLSEVQCLAVHEDFHGRGIGSELVRYCVEKAREKGVLEVMAISASDNFLRNLGFQYALPDQKRALFLQLKTRDQMNSEIDEE
jgi:amino-acid N-acetyltransferase